MMEEMTHKVSVYYNIIMLSEEIMFHALCWLHFYSKL